MRNPLARIIDSNSQTSIDLIMLTRALLVLLFERMRTEDLGTAVPLLISLASRRSLEQASMKEVLHVGVWVS